MYALVRLEVTDFQTWKEAYEDRASARAERGWKGGQVFTRGDNDRKVVLLGEWETAENAEDYFDSSEFRQAMQNAGVKRKPDVTVLEHVEDVALPEEVVESGDDERAVEPGDEET